MESNIEDVTRKVILTFIMAVCMIFLQTNYVLAEMKETNEALWSDNESEEIYKVYEVGSKINSLALENKDDPWRDNILKRQLFEALNIKVEAKEIIIGNKNYGKTTADSSVNDILKDVTKEYLDENNINYDDVESIEVIGNIESIDVDSTIDAIQTKEVVAERVYKDFKENKNIKIKIDKSVKEVVDIVPETKIINDSTLYRGEVKEIQGEIGQKLVQKKVSYINGNVTSEVKTGEIVLKDPKNKEVHKGTKNPYVDGVAFLSHPTQGGLLTSQYGERWSSFHKGIDIAKNVGDTVNAAIDGNVIFAGYNSGGYGNLVIIQHEDDMVTYYAHLSTINVELNSRVVKGDKIGEVGSTGYSTGPHLHFELRVSGVPVDPSKYML